jgi:hypothetical protein
MNSAPDFEAARDALRNAIDIHAGDGILHANLGAIEFCAGNRDIAFTHFSAAFQNHRSFEMPEQYRAAYGLAAWATCLREPELITKEVVHEKLREALLVPESQRFWVAKGEIEAALAAIVGGTVAPGQ